MGGAKRAIIAATTAAAAVLAVLVVPTPAIAVDPLTALGNAEKLDDEHWLVHLASGGTLLTHGPDRTRDMEDHGASIGPGDPERDPICANDYYQHVLYGRPSGAASRYSTVKPAIQASIKRINAVLNESAMQSGGKTADYKVLCDGNGEIAVGQFTANGNSFSDVVDGAQAAGYTRSNVDYSIFYDGTLSGICGTGNFSSDDRLTAGNFNNSGGDYAVSYGNCWDGRTPMHENGHNQGAVQAGAPYSTGSGAHCNETYDVMCYSPDGGNKNQGGTWSRCTTTMYFDCGFDTYFDAEPEGGEWLSSHWNIGSPLNRFIVFDAIREGPPRAAFAQNCIDYDCDFTDLSTDDGTITAWEWDFGDGATSTAQNPSHTYSADGVYTVSLTVTDDLGETGSTSANAYIPGTGDPDPSVETIMPGMASQRANPPQGQWHYFKIEVPGLATRLVADITANACVGPVCNPDMDIYMTYGQRPTREEYDCRGIKAANFDNCTIYNPTAGYWYIGIYTAFHPVNPAGVLSVDYQVKANYSYYF